MTECNPPRGNGKLCKKKEGKSPREERDRDRKSGEWNREGEREKIREGL